MRLGTKTVAVVVIGAEVVEEETVTTEAEVVTGMVATEIEMAGIEEIGVQEVTVAAVEEEHMVLRNFQATPVDNFNIRNTNLGCYSWRRALHPILS